MTPQAGPAVPIEPLQILRSEGPNFRGPMLSRSDYSSTGTAPCRLQCAPTAAIWASCHANGYHGQNVMHKRNIL